MNSDVSVSKTAFRRDLDVVGLCMFLKDSGVGAPAIDTLEDNEIDGEVFVCLTDDEIKSLFPGKLGVAKRLLKIRDMVNDDTGENSPSKASTVILSPAASDRSQSEHPCSPSNLSPSSSVSDLSSFDSCATATHKFTIPTTWRPSIMDCIKKENEETQRQCLAPSIRNEIVRDLVTQMFSYDPMPQKDFCTKAAQLLVKRYPFMKDVGHQVSGFGSWERKIIERVHNVMASNRKRSHSNTSDETSTPSKRGRPRQTSLTFARYPPLKDTGADDVAISRHFDLLHRELKKDNPNKEKVLSLCRQTFAKNREDILEDSAMDLIQKYGELQRSYVMEQEMSLIVEKPNIFSTALAEWDSKWVPAILEYSYTLSGKKAAMVLSLHKKHEGDEEQKSKVALEILSCLLPKKGTSPSIYEQYKVTDDPEVIAKQVMAPRFASFSNDGSYQYFLFVEGRILTQSNSFSRSLLHWFCAHYVFNLEYVAREIALFFQEFVFHLAATGSEKKKSATYLSVTTDIQKYL